MQKMHFAFAASWGVLRRSKGYVTRQGEDTEQYRKANPMQNQPESKIAAQEALAVLEQAFAYYQPEPVLVHTAVREIEEDTDGFAYYRAA
ncbi:hypothetical protein [Salipiger abyssi]|uniref:hypothetical protein n=1 Tax=Salipiger abyssi TaxID=1250539 RepID=UPI004057F4C0